MNTISFVGSRTAGLLETTSDVVESVNKAELAIKVSQSLENVTELAIKAWESAVKVAELAIEATGSESKVAIAAVDAVKSARDVATATLDTRKLVIVAAESANSELNEAIVLAVVAVATIAVAIFYAIRSKTMQGQHLAPKQKRPNIHTIHDFK